MVSSSWLLAAVNIGYGFHVDADDVKVTADAGKVGRFTSVRLAHQTVSGILRAM